MMNINTKTQSDYDYFISNLEKATAQIDKSFYEIKFDDDKSTRYRERVYCYELYHKLRNLLGDEFEYLLHGEVDKNQHPTFLMYHKTKSTPDFIVHKSDQMDNNLVVIEVKSLNSFNDNEIQDNVNNMDFFLRDKEGMQYKYGIVLVFGYKGHNNSQLRIPHSLKSLQKKFPTKVKLYWHNTVGDFCKNIQIED